MNALLQVSAKTRLIVCAVIALFGAHFVSNFYVPAQADARDTQLPELMISEGDNSYNADQLSLQIDKLAVQPAAATSDVQQNPALAAPDRFDRWSTGGYSVALLAIYQQAEPIALLSVQTKDDTTPAIVRLQAGKQYKNIVLTAINKQTVTVQVADKQKKLRLFTAG